MKTCPIVAEIGLNHNGDAGLAIKMIVEAARAGANYVKFQKRVPELSTPKSEWQKPRIPPWGGEPMPYIDYRKRIEFGDGEFKLIDSVCRQAGIKWFASAWDVPSVEFLTQWRPPYVKIPSAKLTDHELLAAAAKTKIPVILSTGMSTLAEIDQAVNLLEGNQAEVILLHCHSAYPAPQSEARLSLMDALRGRYNFPVGFSSHFASPFVAIAAAAWGAEMIEVHFTLDRSLPGSDHASSLEPPGLALLVREVDRLKILWGEPVKTVWESEKAARQRLRGS